MKALVCEQAGLPGKLAIKNLPDPRPGQGEALVDIHAAGLNYADTLLIAGRYQLKPDLPFIPGSEGAGIVRELGDGATGLQVGDRVMFTGGFGAFAEKVCRPAAELDRIPGRMDFVTAAGIQAAWGTSYHALKQRARLREGETLLVLGAAGGVGLAAVGLGAALGATVIAAASTAEKLELARTHGAGHGIDYSREPLRDKARHLTGGRGVDVVYDPVGGELAEQALRALAWGGRFLVVGFASGEIPRLPLNLPLLKSADICGVLYGEWAARNPAERRRNLEELLGMYEDGRIRPEVTKVFAFEQFAEGFDLLSGRRARGKTVMRIRPG